MMMIKKYLAFFGCVVSGLLQAQLTVTDIFNRDLSGETIRLVDWEGYIANPAIKLIIQPPASATFPFSVNLSANHPRLYFDMPSSAGPGGPTKSLIFSNSTPQEIYLSIFPDRAGGNESYTLTLTSSSGTQHFDILVLDHDSANPDIDFKILIDHSHDIPTYNFFANPTHTSIARQAADDWAFFINDMNFDAVPANSQFTWIWTDDFAGGAFVTNPNAYNGFLLYAYGIHTTPHRSGGESSLTSFQTIAGANTGLRRSGGFEAEAHGNYNALGWNTTITDNSWYLGTNMGNVQNDLYSITIHEMGHALCFYSGYPAFQTFKNQGSVIDPAVMAYQQSAVPVDFTDHLSAAPLITDRISRKGAFGSEYANQVPYGRWLITKLHLLVLKAIGYDLKPTSPFRAVNILPVNLPAATGLNYSAFVSAEGGVPFYKYEISSGALPPGLNINSFNGHITGILTQPGTYTFTVKVTDYDHESAERMFTITVGASLGLSNLDAFVEPVIFPNPFQQRATVRLPGQLTEAVLIIYTIQGKEVRRMKVNASQAVLLRDNLAAGVYYYRLIKDNAYIDFGKLMITD